MLLAVCPLLSTFVFASAGDPPIILLFLLPLFLLFAVYCLLSALAIALVALLCSQVFPKLLLLAPAARAAAAAASYICSSIMNNSIAIIHIYQYINIIHK